MQYAQLGSEATICHTPTLEELIVDSDLIVVGKVLFIFPALTIIAFVILLLVILRAFYLQIIKKEKQKISVVELLIVLVVVMLFFALGFPPYRKVALFAPAQTIQGKEIKKVELVYFDEPTYCDRSHLKIRSKYLFFMQRIRIGYRTTGYHWGQWKITDDKIAVSCIAKKNNPIVDKRIWDVRIEELTPLEDTLKMINEIEKKKDDK